MSDIVVHRGDPLARRPHHGWVTWFRANVVEDHTVFRLVRPPKCTNRRWRRMRKRFDRDVYNFMRLVHGRDKARRLMKGRT